jgi:hypothetical protein
MNNLSGRGLIKLPKDIPEKILLSFICSDNNLISLEGGPKEIEGDLVCHSNPYLSLKEIINFIKNCKIVGEIYTDYGVRFNKKEKLLMLSDKDITKILLRGIKDD